MDIRIIPGTLRHVNECRKAFIDSELARQYQASAEQAAILFIEGIRNGEIYIATDINERFLGYIWIDFAGVFSSFPYVRSIAVAPQYRGQGIGKRLLFYFEELGFRRSSRLFLLVSDFNIRAKKLYTEMGYQELTAIPHLFKAEISESLMIKVKT